MTVHIEPISADTVEGFHRALDIVAREHRYLALLEAPPLVETRDFVLGGLARGSIHLVATQSGEVVGWCDITRHPRPSRAHRGTLGMGLVPEARGQGFGRRLVEAALDLAWAASLTRVELDVYCDNAPAIRLYERVGFVREGLTRRSSLIDGQYKDAIAMAILR